MGLFSLLFVFFILIDKIVELELSEWNDIFLYAINFFKNKTSEFKYPVDRIQSHVKEIERFLMSVENRPDALQKIKELPLVWIENILIVDDEEMITDLIRSLLNRAGNGWFDSFTKRQWKNILHQTIDFYS